MDGGDAPREFPDISQKLAAPKKLSAYEKERQAAQAKQQRAEVENAAALKAFESSFAGGDDKDDGGSMFSSGRGPPPGPRRPSWGYGVGGSYGTPPGGPRSGPGSLGPIPGPPPSLKRKRALEEMREAQAARREQEELLDYEREGSGAIDSPPAVAQDQEGEGDVHRPTIELSSLPPDMAVEDIKRLLKGHLEVFSIRLLPPGRGPDEKYTASAIVTLAPDLTTVQIDAAMTALKNKYLGRGFYLSSRHHSTVALHPSIATGAIAASTEPFGAEIKRGSHEAFSLRNAPPPIDQRGFAPPEAYGPGSDDDRADSYSDDAVVSVRPPPTLEEVKAVNSVVDHLLLQPDPARVIQVESMLMSLPEVESDERFAFLYDSQSPAGIYYRYQLWASDAAGDEEPVQKRRDQNKKLIHEDVPIVWQCPNTQVPFADLQSLQQVVGLSDYSSAEESDDGGAGRKFNTGRENEVGFGADEKQHLTPLQRARLTHLLARLPTAIGKLRKGDVARVNNFAISHAATGAEEIADLLLLNIMKPFSSSQAAKYEETEEQDEEDMYEPGEELSALDSPTAQPQTDNRRDDDPSDAKLIAVYVISDILYASATAGAKNAWKYRQLFEAGFKAQQTFEYLGGLEKELAWGKMKAEQWKRKVDVVFQAWEKWSVFSNEVHEALKMSFLEPPLSDGENAAMAAVAADAGEERKRQEERLKGRFKRVGSPGASASPVRFAAVNEAAVNEAVVSEAVVSDVDGDPMSEVDGVAMEGVDGAPLADGVDGEPMEDVDGTPFVDDVDGQPLGGLDGAFDAKSPPPSKPSGNVSLFTAATKAHAKPSGPRKRMTAADMMDE